MIRKKERFSCTSPEKKKRLRSKRESSNNREGWGDPHLLHCLQKIGRATVGQPATYQSSQNQNRVRQCHLLEGEFDNADLQ